MQLHTHSLRSLIGKFVLSAVALGGLAVFANAPAAQAQEFRERPMVRYDSFRQHEAIARYGYFSPRAEYWRHERFDHRWCDRYGHWHRY